MKKENEKDVKNVLTDKCFFIRIVRNGKEELFNCLKKFLTDGMLFVRINRKNRTMKRIRVYGLTLAVASGLLMIGFVCGSDNTKTEKEVEVASEVSEGKKTVADGKTVKNELQVATENEETIEDNSDLAEVESTEEETGKIEGTNTETSDAEKPEKNGNSGSTSNSNSNSSNSNSSSGGNSSSNNSSGGHSGSTSSGGGTSSTTPTHTHNWIPITQTIHHPAETRQEDHGHYETVVDEPAWDEEVTDSDVICLTCYYRDGSIVRLHSQAEVDNHIYYHSSTFNESCQYGNKRFPTGEVIHHEAVTHQEWVSNIVTVTVKEAWDEVVTVGYQCSECGATK